MSEEKVLLLEQAVNGLIKEVHDLRDKLDRALRLKWSIETFRRKLRNEVEIKRRMLIIIKFLKKIDFNKLDIFYSDREKFNKALELFEEAVKEWRYY